MNVENTKHAELIHLPKASAWKDEVGYVHAANESVGFNICKFVICECYNSVLQLPCCGLVFVEGNRVYISPSTTSCNLSALVNIGLTFNIIQVNARRCPACMFLKRNVWRQPIP